MPSDSRHAIIDIGSNTVRLAIFSGTPPGYRRLVDEKSRCRLADGLDQTGRLSEKGAAIAREAVADYVRKARRAGAETIRMVATAAVREASDGPRFASKLERRHGIPIRIVTGAEEARLCAVGVMAGIADAGGIIADLGGGSLELVEVDRGVTGRCATTPLGHVRLGQRAGAAAGALDRIVYAELGQIGWLTDAAGRRLYLAGGAWRKLARRYVAERHETDPLQGFNPPFQAFHAYLLDLLEADAAGRQFPEAVAIAARLGACLIAVVEPDSIEFSTRGLTDGCYVAGFADAPV